MIESKAMEPSQKQPRWEILSDPVLAWVKKNLDKSSGKQHNISNIIMIVIWYKNKDNQQNNAQKGAGRTTQKTLNLRIIIKLHFELNMQNK